MHFARLFSIEHGGEAEPYRRSQTGFETFSEADWSQSSGKIGGGG